VSPLPFTRVAVNNGSGKEPNTDCKMAEEGDIEKVKVTGLLKLSKLLYTLPELRYSTAIGSDSPGDAVGANASVRSMSYSELS
jgi:hypothetical protein